MVAAVDYGNFICRNLQIGQDYELLSAIIHQALANGIKLNTKCSLS